ncbi:MAG: CrcB family protein [Synergistota bacterium]|nr:CrcB family protein [Synergistota bacterium]
MTMSKIACMMGSGALGALCRYGLGGWVQERFGGTFPLGTMAVNVIGCLIFGFLWTLANERYLLSGPLAFMVLTGFVGSFTTFSTMTFEGFRLLSSSAVGAALFYLFGSQLLGIGAAWGGVVLARLL